MNNFHHVLISDLSKTNVFRQGDSGRPFFIHPWTNFWGRSNVGHSPIPSADPLSLCIPGLSASTELRDLLRKVYVDFRHLPIAVPKFLRIFAPTLRIRGNAEVRPPNVKGTVMQTGISGYVGYTSCSRFSIYHKCLGDTILFSVMPIMMQRRCNTT